MLVHVELLNTSTLKRCIFIIFAFFFSFTLKEISHPTHGLFCSVKLNWPQMTQKLIE